MTVGDFGASGVGQRAVGRRGSTSASQRVVGQEVYVQGAVGGARSASASQDGGIVGSGFRSALSRGFAG